MDEKKRRGLRLKQLRQARGLTQDKLAALTDRSVEALSSLERGRAEPSMETLVRLAKAYNMKLVELLTHLDDPDDTPRARTVREITDLCRQLDDRALELVRGHASLVVKSGLRGA